MSVENSELSVDEVVRRAEEIYYRDIRPKVMPQEKGKFLSLDIYSGDYEVDEDGLLANRQLRARRPDGEFFGIRVGYTAANKMSGTLTEDSAPVNGVVNPKLKATLDLRLRGPNSESVVTAVIDTGYDDYLSLPFDVIRELDLTRLEWQLVEFADGSRRRAAVYEVEVAWDDRFKNVRVLCFAGDPVIGTKLLKGYNLRADFTPRGIVQITRL